MNNILHDLLEKYPDRMLVVSRHLGAILWIQTQLPGVWEYFYPWEKEPGTAPGILKKGSNEVEIRVLPSATKENVLGKIVVGNVPMSLAQHADMVVAVEFNGQPPRGTEYTFQDMSAAGAKLVPYIVVQSLGTETRWEMFERIRQS